MLDQNALRRRGVGLIASDPETVSPGYVLIAPLTSNQVHLINVEGKAVRTWTLPWRNGRHARILANGNLAVNSIDPDTSRPFFFFNKYGGGIMSEIEPESGKIVRQYRDPLGHHDAHHYGDGRILHASFEQLSEEDSQSILGGVPGTEAPDGRVWADVVKEVDSQGKVLWIWHAAEHLDRKQFPLQAPYPREHYPLVNSVWPLKDGNVLLSLRSVSAVVIVSRATGEVLWHLDSTVVAQQHCAHELDNGNILLFDNGAFRHHESFQFSRVVEVDRATKEVVWQWTDPTKERFYSPFMGGVQRLKAHKGRPNTLICESAFGRVFEVDGDDNVCWEYINPYFATYSEKHVSKVFPSESNALFRAYKYRPEEVAWLKDDEFEETIVA